MPNCCICNRETTNGKTFTLTEEERQAIGPEAEEQVSYCAACLKVMSDRESGAQLLKGFYEMRLRERGVPNARDLSEKFLAQLLRATAQKMH